MVEASKLYHSISEVAAMFDVNASLIRYWEKEFDIIKPRKNAKGNRLFTQQDIDNIALIHHYVKERRLTLEGARQKIKENRDDAENSFQVVQSLKKIRAMLLEIKDNIGGLIMIMALGSVLGIIAPMEATAQQVGVNPQKEEAEIEDFLSVEERKIFERYDKAFGEVLKGTDIYAVKRNIDNTYRKAYNELWALIGTDSQRKMQLISIAKSMQTAALKQMELNFDKKTVDKFKKQQKKKRT